MKKLLLIAGVVALAAVLFVWLKLAAVQTDGSESESVNTAEFVEDVHFRAVSIAGAKPAEKVQVQEFFWYGCPHCQRFEPQVRQFKKSLADDVELVQIPVTWNESTRLHAAIHFVAISKNASEELHDRLFETIIAVRSEGNLLKHVQEVEAVFASHGLDAGDFQSQLSAPEIEARVEEASQMMKSAEISSTPVVMVDSRWVVLSNQEVANAGVFNVVNHLIDRARSERQ